ncbi:WD40 repeat domain-containing protein [Urbifossiella limnaea]|uniref:Translocation protein TolB n=1 Tax=Urbifossiella limnaea TaxID=2528023 RepID=A0A517XZF8_9BACT|nr:PD40 domain-containing protein [Urbifossiella limnaea]QDU22848.1 translocation protein TolB [Urbifossiella limnaea]
MNTSIRAALAFTLGLVLTATAFSQPNELLVLKGADTIRSVTFSPDATILASGANDGTVILWDVKSGKELAAMKFDKRFPNLAFSPDAKALAVAHEGSKEVILLDVQTRKERFRLKAETVWHIAFRPKTNTLAVGGLYGSCKLWDVETGKEQASLALGGATLSLRAMKFSPDGKLLACGHKNGGVSVWDVDAQKKVASGGANHGFGSHAVSSVAFTPDAAKLMFFSGTGGYGGPGDVRPQSISHWEFTKGKQPANYRSAESYVSGISFSPDGRWLAIVDGGTLKLSQWPGVQQITAFKGIRPYAFSPDSKLLATVGAVGEGDKSKTITLWELK